PAADSGRAEDAARPVRLPARRREERRGRRALPQAGRAAGPRGGGGGGRHRARCGTGAAGGGGARGRRAGGGAEAATAGYALRPAFGVARGDVWLRRHAGERPAGRKLGRAEHQRRLRRRTETDRRQGRAARRRDGGTLTWY